MPLKQKAGCTKITTAELCYGLENPFTKSALNRSYLNAAKRCVSVEGRGGKGGEGEERKGRGGKGGKFRGP